MQLMSDALAVLGSRHGVIFEPLQRRCRLVRFSRFDDAPIFHLRAGLRVGDREVVFPLCPAGDAENFALLDQRTTPCTWSLIGIDAETSLKLKLTVTIPWQARDANFSTTPVLLFDLEFEPLGGQYRWDAVKTPPPRAELFFEITGSLFKAERHGGVVDLLFQADRILPDATAKEWWQGRRVPIAQRNRLVVIDGEMKDTTFFRPIKTARPSDVQRLRVAWCAWSNAALEINHAQVPFRYTKQFHSLNDVATWAKRNADEVIKSAAQFDAVAADPALGVATQHLLAHTFHSWLVNTWWAVRPDGREWFSVWEGNCYFHSTVDVEFTQSPFYLAFWPELLGLQLDQWTQFTKPAEKLIGAERARDTSFLSHDCGWGCAVNGQSYPHEMEVEETANWIILAFAHSRRTGDDSIVQTHSSLLARFVRFLLAADTDGDGIPDRGVANTIDDGSPAIQFGHQQTYLAVKTLGALTVAQTLLKETRQAALAREVGQAAKKISSRLQTHGWAGDHFNVLLEKSGRLKDPWTGKEQDFAEIPGWDAPHIYTANTLPILDMVGVRLPLDEERVRQDLQTATARCLRAYGCAHTDFRRGDLEKSSAAAHANLAGTSRNPGWLSMNFLRDLAAAYRGLDFSALAQRYWDWQVLTNTQGTALFHETFAGNHLHFYPRGIALWGIFDARNRVAIDLMHKPGAKKQLP